INYFGELSHYEVYATTVAEAVEEAGLDLPEHVAINYGLDEAVFRGMVISIEEGDFVTVRVDGESTLYPIEKSKDLTVAQLLKEKGIELGEDDIVTPELETVVEANLSVSIERVTYEEVKEKETIPFSTTTKNSSDLYKGETKVQTEGANGEKEITYRIQYVDGVETDKTVVKETTVTKAVTKVVLKGTKEESAAVMNSSSDSSRKWNGIAEGATISGTATHYCACAKCCGDKTVFTTASGLRVYTGMENPYIVACNWLPLGTKVRVNGTVYTVSDTGGSSLNGKGRIDIFVPQGHSAAVRLGKQSVTIEVLELAKTN
ncbi:MAG: G5 domain-containing protein, partial [Clostridiales bacterium]|nr:G5 domain-containing protein [Clostridiales bacterium]